MQPTALEERLHTIIVPPLEAMGYDLVHLHMAQSKQHGSLQIMAERKDGAPMGLDDCTRISHHVSALLDVDDPIPHAYTLEVSSPGLDRPLNTPKDFMRFIGEAAKIELKLPQNGQRRFSGIIRAVRDGVVTLEHPHEGAADIAFTAIGKAKLSPEKVEPKKKKKGKH